MIYAWDNYPIKQFPPLWNWLESLVRNKQIVLPSVAFDEVNHKTPECTEWLKQADLDILPINNSVLQGALVIKDLLGIFNDNFHPDGVDENDLLIIASARAFNVDLVSEEGRQPTLPENLRRYKIPAVCKMTRVNVNCLSFLNFIKNSEQVFE